MAKIKNRTGEHIGRLTIVGPSKRTNGATYWFCHCECGVEKYIRAENLGKTTNSCGCICKETLRARQFKHGYDGTPIYHSWRAMRFRCSNPNADCWNEYGGRGITVCDRWQSFENFLADMGERPDGYSIERIDVNGNYEPSNCKWIPRIDQWKNRRSNKLNELQARVIRQARKKFGVRVNHLAEIFGVTRFAIHDVISEKTWKSIS